MLAANVEVVVARYNERLEWLLEKPFNEFQYTVYNKGPNDNFEKSNVTKIISLPNVGRCDHTFLYHIVQNYDNLANVTVFFPGSINMMNKKDNAVRILENIKKYRMGIFLGSYTNDVRVLFNNFTLDKYMCTSAENLSQNNESYLLPSVIRPYGKWFKYHFGNIKVKYYCICGILSISKHDITRHDINRYKQLLRTVETHSNPEAGHYIERSWAAIFHPLLCSKVILHPRTFKTAQNIIHVLFSKFII